MRILLIFFIVSLFRAQFIEKFQNPNKHHHHKNLEKKLAHERYRKKLEQQIRGFAFLMGHQHTGPRALSAANIHLPKPGEL